MIYVDISFTAEVQPVQHPTHLPFSHLPEVEDKWEQEEDTGQDISSSNDSRHLQNSNSDLM